MQIGFQLQVSGFLHKLAKDFFRSAPEAEWLRGFCTVGEEIAQS